MDLEKSWISLMIGIWLFLFKGGKMTTNEILNLDYTQDENKVIIQKALRRIKPFQDIPLKEKIDLLKLEILVGKYERKYNLMINYICPTFIPGERNIYCATIKMKDSTKIIEYIYATEIYELFAKISIYFFYCVEKGKVKKIDWKEFKNKMKERISS